MHSRIHYLTVALAIGLLIGVARAQEPQPGARPPGGPVPTGPEKKYYDLTKSKDPKTKGFAERYLNLVKFQEWGDASGKFTTVAKYVSHNPDLSRVKLGVGKGSGKDRTIREVEIEVAKLSKVCQSRIKQIDTLQKRLDELAATAGQQDPGSPMIDERGVNPEGAGPGVVYAGPGEAPAAPASTSPPAAEADPSASEPDPLGFAELPPIAAAPVGPGGAVPGVGPANPDFASFGARAPGKAGQADRKQWRVNLAAFAANMTVTIDPMGQPTVDWGELKELGEMNALAVAKQSGTPQSPEAETPAAISERLGDVQWQVVVAKVEEAPGGLMEVQFRPFPFPQPLELRLSLAETEEFQKWSRIAPGTPVNITARLTIMEPYKITAKVKLADAK